MASQGPNFPTAATGNTNTIGGGTRTWGTPTNIEASDNLSASCNLITVPSVSDDLIGTGFGFTVPNNATINGILLEVRYSSSSTVAIEQAVRLLKAGTAAGANKSTGATIPTTATTVSYGGSADLWSTTWTPSDINGSNFGAATVYNTGIDTVNVDFFRITVTYTPGPGAGFLLMF